MTGLEVVVVVAVLAAAWLRMAGAAVSELPRADAHHDAAEGTAGARTVARLLDDRHRVGASVAVVGTALLVVGAVLAALVVGAGTAGGAQVLSVVATGVAIVLVADVIPRLVGRRWPRAISYRSAPILAGAVAIAGWAAERVPDENGVVDGDEDEEDDEDELALISSVLRFTETVVREVMVPRQDMVTVEASADADELAAAATEHGYSRFPVVHGDDVVGLLLVKDLLSRVGGGVSVTAGDVMRPVVFVPEVKPIADLLAEMRASRTHMTMVVDEFGDIAGLVTIEDILEELVGEIADETDDEEIWVQPVGASTWRVDARISVEDLAEMLEIELPEGDWDTVGGLVLGLAERVPEESERFEVDAASFTVARMQGRRVAEVIVDTPAGVGESR